MDWIDPSVPEPTDADRAWLARVREAGSLTALAATLGVESGHEAYLAAKPAWFQRRGRELAADGRSSCEGASPTAIPGSCTRIDGVAYHVHGITHADTPEERTFLQTQTEQLPPEARVLCEQGIRGLYFADTDVSVMDDYRWALARCRATTPESYVAGLLDDRIIDPSGEWMETAARSGGSSGSNDDRVSDSDGGQGSEPNDDRVSDSNGGQGSEPNDDRVSDSNGGQASESNGGRGSESNGDRASESDGDRVSESDGGQASESNENRGSEASESDPADGGKPVTELQRRFRETALSLLEADVDDAEDSQLRRALTDVVSAFPATHEDLATGRDAASAELRRRAATDPTQLGALQTYYERAFLPQRLEREWLARHDADLEIVTHARNARMADYAVAYAARTSPTDAVHLIVGAAHGPGVREYLEAHRDGSRQLEEFEPV